MRLLLIGLFALLAAAAPAASPDREAQFAKIDAAVAKFPAQVDGRTDVYFLGFAGDGEEKVFAEEIKLAAQRVGAKYGSAARSVLLINDRRDLTTWPLATGINLDHAARAIARVMNRDEDVLFLALSSHGNRYAQIIVENTGVPESGLDADSVAQVLRAADIRWKIVVVSACYAGTFIRPLADDHSVIITAASKSRSSFGCSDDRDLTYFGEAFYRDALPGAARLRDAVDAARGIIRAREKAEGVKPSHPQSFFGSMTERKLAELEAREK